jgi:hypothetical protein
MSTFEAPLVPESRIDALNTPTNQTDGLIGQVVLVLAAPDMSIFSADPSTNITTLQAHPTQPLLHLGFISSAVTSRGAHAELVSESSTLFVRLAIVVSSPFLYSYHC